MSSEAEIKIIEKFFRDYKIEAKINRTRSFVAGKCFIVFAIALGAGTPINKIEKRLRELSETMSDHRGKPCPVRLRTMPLALELPHPAIEPVFMPEGISLAPHTMALGSGYGFSGESRNILDLSKTPHILVAGTTGSGKSTLMTSMLYSLLLNTSPADLRIVLIDLKNEDLEPFIKMPHVDFAAMSLDAAEEAIGRLFVEKDRRVAEGRGNYQRLLLVIDELAELGNLPGAKRQLSSILSIGRSKGINVMAATQKPTADVVGSTNKANFTYRLVGRVMSGDDAKVAAGQTGSGAEFLPGNGAFLGIDGTNTERFQAYYTPDLDERLGAVKLKWFEQLSFALPDVNRGRQVG